MIAQLVARRSHNPKVVSSILTHRMNFFCESFRECNATEDVDIRGLRKCVVDIVVRMRWMGSCEAREDYLPTKMKRKVC